MDQIGYCVRTHWSLIGTLKVANMGQTGYAIEKATQTLFTIISFHKRRFTTYKYPSELLDQLALYKPG